MKKSRILSLILAVLMMAVSVPMFAFPANAAADDKTTYLVYEQDFEDIAAGTTGNDLFEALGWYIPEAKASTNIANYTVRANGSNKALRVNTLGEGTTDSFVSIFGGDVMAILSRTEFTLSYRLTYSPETTNNDGYASIIYNYNEEHGAVAGQEEKNEVYGIAAVRMCGTGFSAVYYPAKGPDCAFHSLEKQPGSPNVMSNRYDTYSAQPSIYARLFDGNESATALMTGTQAMANRPLNIEVSYDVDNGVYVSVNGERVSDMNTTQNYNSQIRNDTLWKDFIDRNSASTLALLVQAGVVVDIDNITVSTSNINAATGEGDVPALVITEICGMPSPGWAQFIELTNPNDFEVDLANYSLVWSSYCVNGLATDNIDQARNVVYSGYLKLSDYLGKKVYDPRADQGAIYLGIADLEKMPSGNYELLDDKTYRNDNGTIVEDPKGGLRKVRRCDSWNERYVQGSSDYEHNTMLKPGECALIFLSGTYDCWTTGALTNAGLNDTTDFASKGFRYQYSKYGLPKDAKVVHIPNHDIADGAGRTYYIGKSVDENNNEIDYKQRYITDYNDIECITPYQAGIALGLMDENIDPSSSNLGKAGWMVTNTSGSYVYGIDASGDFRVASLYYGSCPVNKTNTSHVGKLAGYQRIILGNFFTRTQKTPELMITEIMPHTTNLAGAAYNAFAAMELTNATDSAVNVYNYALAQSELNHTNGGRDNRDFIRSTVMRAGNPINAVTGNGAYYYFAEDHVKNPETCVLQPGESVVVWFLNADTYNSYYNDDDFGFSYFRQYWVNQGCAALGEKGVDGEYNVPVIAVDGCSDVALNQSNASRVFTVSSTSSAVYGVANSTADVQAGTVAISDVISIACFSMNSIYYRVTKTAQKKADGSTIYANTMKCAQVPVNTGMRYVANMTYSNRISGMVQSLKVTSYYYRSGVLSSTDPEVKLRMEHTTTLALQEPGLGALSDAEAYCARNTFFLTTKEDGKNVARYYNEKKAAISTLDGAALATTGTTPMLRFDNAIKSEVYSSLVATYGAANVKVGMLICMTDDLKNDTKMTAEGLTAAGVQYIDVASKLQYYKGEYAVLGTTVAVNEKNYNTEYTAVGYLKVTTADGTEHTFWSYTTSTRSVFDVAKAALKDVTAKEGGVYVNKVDNKFSPYTEAERAVLESFMK